MGVWIIIILLVIGSLILGPIGFFLAMRLFDRVERLESSNDLQSKTLNHLKELCQSLQGKLDELEKLARLQQLSQQAVPDLTATATENQTSDFSPQASGFASDTNPGSQSPRSETLFLKSEARSLKPQSESVVEIVPEISQEPAQPVASFLETVEPISPIVDAPVDALQQPSGRQPPIETVLPAVKHKIAADLRVAEPTVTPPHVFVQQSQGGLPHSERQRGRSECDRLPVKPAKKTVEADSTSSQWLSLELLIGRKVLPWVASGLFLLFAVFLIQYAFEKGWITEVYKVIGMGLLSAIFLGVGKYFAVKRLRYFATALTSAGISIAFLAGYATYGFYNLLPPQYATVLMTAVVVGSFLLSRYYVSRLLGIVSIIAGLAVPLLLGSETDLYNEFFSYLILLNIGTVVLINVMKRPPIAVLAFVGTQIEFWLWYRGNYMPDKIRSVILFQAAFYFVYLIDTSLATLRPKQRATWDDAMRAIISPALFYGT
ncbi:MAG: DUF2339 domain-containing protein, partial [Planctomycetaceae bacterium]|nr:DUF2339 domain-containing protein [Planctomycetaceae bacterium]